MQAKRDFGVLIVGALAAVAGIGEVVVGITGNYLGILFRLIAPPIVRVFYSLGGLFILTQRKWGQHSRNFAERSIFSIRS